MPPTKKGYFVALSNDCGFIHPLKTMIQKDPEHNYYPLLCSHVDTNHHYFVSLYFSHEGKEIQVSLPYHVVQAIYLLEDARSIGFSKK
jgi:hypothetical protein